MAKVQSALKLHFHPLVVWYFGCSPRFCLCYLNSLSFSETKAKQRRKTILRGTLCYPVWFKLLFYEWARRRCFLDKHAAQVLVSGISQVTKQPMSLAAVKGTVQMFKMFKSDLESCMDFCHDTLFSPFSPISFVLVCKDLAIRWMRIWFDLMFDLFCSTHHSRCQISFLSLQNPVSDESPWVYLFKSFAPI